MKTIKKLLPYLIVLPLSLVIFELGMIYGPPSILTTVIILIIFLIFIAIAYYVILPLYVLYFKKINEKDLILWKKIAGSKEQHFHRLNLILNELSQIKVGTHQEKADIVFAQKSLIKYLNQIENKKLEMSAFRGISAFMVFELEKLENQISIIINNKPTSFPNLLRLQQIAIKEKELSEKKSRS